MAKLTVSLTPDAKDVLIRQARLEGRDPRIWAGLFIEQTLERLGLLQPEPIRREVANATSEQLIKQPA